MKTDTSNSSVLRDKSVSIPRGFFDPVFGIINQAEELFTPRVSFVTFNIDYELFAQLLRAKALSGHLYLDNGGVILQKKIHPGRLACIARCVFFCPDVIKEKIEKAVKKILEIVFVFNLVCAAIIVTLT